MATTKVNQVYNTIQPASEAQSGTNSIILYANKYSGVREVSMNPAIADIMNSDYGEVGNNLLVQLNQKVQYFPGGPWFVDSRDGVIYIHNRKNTTPVKTYTYQGGNGEVLSVDFTIQYVNKTMHGTVSAGISPNKELHVDVCENLSEKPKTETSKNKKTYYDYLYGDDSGIDPLRIPNVAVRESTKDYLADNLSWDEYQLVLDHYDPNQALRVALPNRVSVLEKYQKEMDAQKMAYYQSTHRSIEESYKTYKAKGGNKEAIIALNKADVNRVLDEANLEPEVRKVLVQSTGGVRDGVREFASMVKQISLSDKDQLEPYLKQLFGSTSHTFDQQTETHPYSFYEDYVDPSMYYEYDPKINNALRDTVKATSNTEEFKARAGYKRLKDGMDPDIMVTGELQPYTVSVRESAGGKSYSVRRTKYRVKVFRRSKSEPVMIPQYQLITSYFTRNVGPAGSWADVEKRIREASNKNKRITERKLICKMSCIGNPYLESSQIIQINNVGSKWSGAWYIKGCTHQMNAGTGYTCMLDLVKYKGSLPTTVTSASADTRSIQKDEGKAKSKPKASEGSDFNLKMTHDEAALFQGLSSEGQKLELVTAMFAGREQDKLYKTTGVVLHTVNSSTSSSHTSYTLSVNPNIKITDADRKKYYRRAAAVIRQFKESTNKKK